MTTTFQAGPVRSDSLAESKPAPATTPASLDPNRIEDQVPDARDVRLPANRFLWAVLDAPASARHAHGRGHGAHASPLAPGLLPQLAEHVHVDPDTLAAVGTPLDDGRMLVCAIEHATLDPHRSNALSVAPEAIPECVGGGGATLDPARLDLLVGPFIPFAAQRCQRLRHLLAASAVCVCAVLAALGLSRRAAVWDRTARDADSRAALIASSIGPAVTPFDLPLLADDAQRRTQSVRTLGTPQPVAPVLARVLADWPATAPPTSLVVDDRSILASALVTGDPGAFLAALQAPEGWRAQEPRLSTYEQGTQITIVVERVAP